MSQHQFKHPNANIFSWFLEKLCNGVMLKKIRRTFFSVIPFVKMKSEVKDIVYVNWLVDTQTAAKWAPINVELMDINGKTILTVLTYQHGNFRPSFMGLLRLIFPSPFQSNWRLYVSSLNGVHTTNTVLFIKNIMSSVLYTVSTRVFSDSMQTHLARRFQHNGNEEYFETKIEAGIGSSPEYSCIVETSDDLAIPDELLNYFGNQEKVLSYLCLQHFALSEGDDFKGVCKAEIELPIDIHTIQPLKVTHFQCDWLHNLVGEVAPFSFLVPNVRFEVVNEHLESNREKGQAFEHPTKKQTP